MESERFLLNKIRQHLKENYNLITEFKLGICNQLLLNILCVISQKYVIDL